MSFKLLIKFLFFNNYSFIRLLLIALIIFSSIVEVFSVYAIYPLVSVLFDINTINFDNRYLNELNSFLTSIPKIYLITISFTLLILNSFLLFLTQLSIYKYVYHNGYKISKNLFTIYLKKDLIYFAKKNKSELVKNIINECQRFIDGIMLQIYQAISKFIPIIFVISLLLLIDFTISIFSIVILSLIYLIYFFIFKKKIRKISRDSSKYLANMHRSLNEAFNLVDIIKIDKKYDFFIKRLNLSIDDFKNYNFLTTIFSISPKYLVEILIFLFFLFFFIFTYESYNLISYLPILSIYFYGMVRILPHIQSIFHSYSTISVNYNAFLIISDQINSEQEYAIKSDSKIFDTNQQFTVTLQNVEFVYDNKKKFKFNVNFKKGNNIALFGESGSGKSTFIKVLTGLLYPKKGKIEVTDHMGNKLNYTDFKNSISYMPQNINLINDNIEKNISLQESISKQEKKMIFTILKKFNLSDFKYKLSKTIGDNGNNLSGGQRQRLALSRMLFKNSNILVLDEIDTYLDRDNINLLIKYILKDKSKTIIFSTHNKNLLKYANKVIRF